MGLNLVILPGKNPPDFLKFYYTKAYETWHAVWSEASAELEGFPSKLYSNDFIRQDEILAVFNDDDCTSLGFWTELDMTFLASRSDQYFQAWDEESLMELTKFGPYIGKYSFFTVAKHYRTWSREVGISLTDLQVALFGYRLLESSCTAMTGTTRNNRKINLVCARGGAQLIKENILYYGSEANLMAWYRDTARPHIEVAHLAQKLWMNKLDFKTPNRRTYVSRKETSPTL